MQLRAILLVAALVGQALSITPALKDTSDKKHAANYPQDTRPVVDKNILNKLKSDKEPYPSLQSRSNFDKDFVKDSNQDTGSWKAQFEYDALRKKMLAEEAAEKAAADKAAKEGKDVTEAQKKAGDAATKAADAKKEKDAAKNGEDAAKNKDEGADKKKDDGADKATKAEMEAKLKTAEKDYEEQKIAFKKCQEELDAAKVKYEELKVQVAEMQTKSAASVKLFAEQSDAEHKAKLNVKRLAVEAASAKREAAELRFTAADHSKAHFEEVLRKETAESQQAQKNLRKVKDEKAQVKADLEKSAQRLQKLKGYAPDAPVKSGAAVPTALFSLMLSTVVFIFF